MFLDAILNHSAQASTNNINHDIAMQNIAFQSQENAITRAREDNAVQRRAADLRAAGLSQTLAAGNPASAQALTAPHNDYQHVSPLQKALERIDLGGSVLDLKSKLMNIKQQQADIDHTVAETAATNTATEINQKKYADEHTLALGQVDLISSQVAQNKAETALTNIVGEYKAQELEASIDEIIARTSKENVSKDLIRQQVTSEIKKQLHLETEVQALAEEIAINKLKQEEIAHDLSYAREHGYPVGAFPSGLAGTILNSLDYANNFGKSKLGSEAYNFLFHTGAWLGQKGQAALDALTGLF